MERIHTLIDKLSQQKTQGASPAHLLFTVQLLQQELIQLQKSGESLSTRKVAVTLPFNTSINIPETVLATSFLPIETPEIADVEKEIYVLDLVEEEEPREEAMPFISQPLVEEKREYNLRKPVLQESFFEEPKPVVKEEYRPYFGAQELFNSAFETTSEVPTLSQYATATEVNEKIAERKESLNDRLKQQQIEVAHLLKEAPIKDLRKGIGINDRFAFVRELFRNDEAAYERSIKTINGFGIYTEAEYWMSRELKLKLGWDENSETVKHFYQLVRRRFS